MQAIRRRSRSWALPPLTSWRYAWASGWKRPCCWCITCTNGSIASTSRWWKLECDKTGRKREAETTACAFMVKLRGVIDGSRLQLVRHALQRRDIVRHALHRDVDFHVDVDSQGGEI